MSEFQESSLRCVCLSLVALMLSGCVTTQVSKDVIATQNEHLEAMEQPGAEKIPEEVVRRLEVLFADNPEYAPLVRRGDDRATLPRLRTSVPPTYPMMAYLTKTEAIVKVAFIISESGKVEGERIYEASDERFSEAALAAVRKWTFYPGTIDGVPVKFVFVAPLHFEMKK